ncbi:unnamed protein product [Brugia timori]|uniref:SCP domain-containing protein n=1 Tax=Brugia timori TaxID=42155 RepID=A0A0R3QYD6_9BILA|nr:unnamed protein product [Brugia timori]
MCMVLHSGIGFEPRKRSMKKEQNIFRWNIDDPTSYAFYVRRLRRILYEYAKMEIIPSKFKIDCKKTVVPYVGGKPVKHFCKIEATNTDENYGYGDCALSKKVFVLHFCLYKTKVKDHPISTLYILNNVEQWKTRFGYDIGTLCVMLRINKLFGYYPESPTYDLFANSSLDFEAYKICDQVANVTACCNDDRMLFQCSVMEGNTNVTIVQYPKFGYPYCFYPFNNQDDWNSMCANSTGPSGKITHIMRHYTIAPTLFITFQNSSKAPIAVISEIKRGDN